MKAISRVPASWGALLLMSLLAATDPAMARSAQQLSCETGEFPLILQNILILEDDRELPDQASR
ncbi:MAG: hypothetical protein AAGA68_09305 [Pseudomonadota bacterium]